MMNTLMKLAPFGAGGAIAFHHWPVRYRSVARLELLMGSFYLTCLLFIFVVLGTVSNRDSAFCVLSA